MMHHSKKSSHRRFEKKKSPRGQGEKKSREIDVGEICMKIDQIYNPDTNRTEYSEDGLIEAQRLYTMYIKKVKDCIVAQTKVLSPDINVIMNLIITCFKESISTHNYTKKTLYRLFHIKQKPMIDKYVKHVFNDYAERNEKPTNYEDILTKIRSNDAERSSCPKHHFKNSYSCKCVLNKLNDREIMLGIYTRASTYKCQKVMISLYDLLSKQKEYDDKKLTAWHCAFWGAKGQPHTKENVMEIADVIKNGPFMPILRKNDKGETGIDSLFHNDNLSMDDRLEIYDHVMMLNKKEALKIFMGISNKITDKDDSELSMKCAWVLICQPDEIINEIASIIMRINVSQRIEKSKNIENVIAFVYKCLTTNHETEDDQLKLNRFFNYHTESIVTLTKNFPILLLHALHNIDTTVHGMDGEYAVNKLNDRMISISMGIGELNKYDDSIFKEYFRYLASQGDSIYTKMLLYSVCQSGVRESYVIEGLAHKHRTLTDNKLKFAILDWFDEILGKGCYDIDSILEGTVDTDSKKEETKTVEEEVDEYANQSAVIRMVQGSKSAKTERDLTDTIDDVKYSIEQQLKKNINCLNYPYEMLYSYCDLYTGKKTYTLNVLPTVLKGLVAENVFTQKSIVESFNKLTEEIINEIKTECPRIYDVIDIFNTVYGESVIKFKKKEQEVEKKDEMQEELNYGNAIRDNLSKVALVPREYGYYFDPTTMQMNAIDTITSKRHAMEYVNINGTICWKIVE